MYQIGQKVKVVKNLCGHGFRNKQIVRVTKLDSQGKVYACESLLNKRPWFMDESEVIPVKPFPHKKLKKKVCIIILSIIVIAVIVTTFLHDGDVIGGKVSWAIMGLCYLAFFPTFGTLIGIDEEKRMNDGNRITRRSK